MYMLGIRYQRYLLALLPLAGRFAAMDQQGRALFRLQIHVDFVTQVFNVDDIKAVIALRRFQAKVLGAHAKCERGAFRVSVARLGQ